ncbi:MAG TPA: PQ-loop domain-containing transporter [Vicinamibacterales bacterium]|nr:PQ-loop domain-containing transporter [Vicinamibacterales bacterium]
MIDVNWSAAIGTAGTACSALSFLPQFLKVRRQGGRDLSAAMLALLLAGGGLWLAYGILNGATAVIVANTAVLILVSAVAGLKVIHATRARRLERRPRIAIDMDDVMADALAEHLRRYNAAYGANLGLADVQGRHLEECIPPGHRAAAEAMLDASFFEDLAVLPECQAVVRELAERYDVFIASAAMDVPCSFDAKYRWLRRHFPFIPPSNIVFCGDKSIVDADYLIDDRARHFTRFKGEPMLFSAPHNAAETAYPRVASWKEVRDHFARLESRSAPGVVRSYLAAR